MRGFSVAMPERLRLTLIGGFLGSGKTTWLRHQLYAGRFGAAHVIVNEAAELPVDDVLLSAAARLSVLAGGCACCTGRGELVAHLRQLCDARGRGVPFSEIVLETSGLADPGAIVAAVRADPLLVHHILMGEIIVAVDGLNGLDHLKREALGRAQTEVADHLVVTKAEEAPALPRLIATLRRLNPGAIISAAEKGEAVPLPDIAGATAEDLPALDGAAPRPAIFPAVLALDGSADWPTVTLWLSALLHARGDDVLRVKGVIRTPAGRLLLQSVRKVMNPPELLPEQEDRADGSLAVIGSGYRPQDLALSLRFFTSIGS